MLGLHSLLFIQPRTPSLWNDAPYIKGEFFLQLNLSENTLIDKSKSAFPK